MKLNNLFAKVLMTVMAILCLASCKKSVYYNIATSVQPVGSGRIVVSPSSESVLDGTSVTFQAKTNGDYIFTGWSGSLSGTDNPSTVVASSDLNVVANFQLREYPLSLSVEGEGSIQERVVSTKTDYPSGTVVELTAKAAEHWIFDHWEGDLTGKENPVQITISAAKTVKAVFVKKMYDLTVTVEGEGAVQEKVLETKGTYQEGMTVELAATPATGWSFDHWEGDLSGKENPLQITVSSGIIVTAVFTKNKYAYNLKIVGPGAVDEFLIETKTGFDYGTIIQLKAYPDITQHAIFKGWSGDVKGSDQEISFCLDKDISIIASFATEANKHPLPNLHLPTSMRKDIYFDVVFPNSYCCEYCALDYNQDGYVDLITCYNTGEIDARNFIQFYTGQPDGTFLRDDANSNRFLGLIVWRKSLYGDFNDDNVPDVCFVGHGWDAEPWPGEYPVLLLSAENGLYKETRFTDIIGYFHGSAAGDYDNDGDLDIFLLDHASNSWFLINDGKGNFTPNQMITPTAINGGTYTTEFFDINHDGYLDLFIGGHEHEGPEWHQYTNQTFVFWGNGATFNHDDYCRFPRFDSGWGVTLDYIFEDLDGDGREEIINCRTGDGIGQEAYMGWAIQIVSFDGNSFIDVTHQYFDANGVFNKNAIWLVKISLEEIGGVKYLIGLNCGGQKQKLFRFDGDRFVRCEEESVQPLNYTSGMCFYSDGVGSRGEHAYLNYTSDPYSGSSCIRFTNWPTWNGWSVDYEDWVDFSELEKQGYVFEFAIKNSDPDLVLAISFETRLQTDPWYFPSYGYTYLGSEHKCDGSWELVRVPLSSMTCDPEWTGYYWNTIKTLNIMPGECHGQDFYLDEIRIRKVLPNDQ